MADTQFTQGITEDIIEAAAEAMWEFVRTHEDGPEGMEPWGNVPDVEKAQIHGTARAAICAALPMLQPAWGREVVDLIDAYQEAHGITYLGMTPLFCLLNDLRKLVNGHNVEELVSSGR